MFDSQQSQNVLEAKFLKQFSFQRIWIWFWELFCPWLFPGLQTFFENNSWPPSQGTRGGQNWPRNRQNPLWNLSKTMIHCPKGATTSTRWNQVSGPAMLFPKIVLIPRNLFDPQNVKKIFSKDWKLIVKMVWFRRKRIRRSYFSKAARIDEWTGNDFLKPPVFA